MSTSRSVLSVLLVLLSGCAAEPMLDAELVPIDEGEGEAPSCVFIVTEPNEQLSDAEAVLFAGRGRRTVYLNRRGATYNPGYDDSARNTSSIIGRPARIPAFEGSDGDWTYIMQCVRDQFAPFDVEVTDVDPGATPHIEVAMGGTPGLAGQGSGVGGVAPMNGDCSIVERAVVYVFTAV